LINERLLAKCC